MAGIGKRVTFHGSFSDKGSAEARRRARPGAGIIRRDIYGLGMRWIVIRRLSRKAKGG